MVVLCMVLQERCIESDWALFTIKVYDYVMKPLGFRIQRHLDEVGFHTHVISPYKLRETTPWKLIRT